MHKRFPLYLLAILASCTAIRELSYDIEEPHNALYKQKALLVYAVEPDRVLLSNPSCTRCYYLKGKKYLEKWEPGDTLIINDNLEDFYSLRYSKKCR